MSSQLVTSENMQSGLTCTGLKYFAITRQNKTKWKIFSNMNQGNITAFLYVMHSKAGFLVIEQGGLETGCELCEIFFSGTNLSGCKIGAGANLLTYIYASI